MKSRFVVVLFFLIFACLLIVWPKTDQPAEERQLTKSSSLVSDVEKEPEIKDLLPIAGNNTNTSSESASENILATPKKEAASKPQKIEEGDQILIEVPFSSQAPDGAWQLPFKEACEEAAIMMAAHWLNNKPLDKETAKKEILDLVDYQNKNYGDYIDTTAIETAKLANDFYAVDDFEILENAKLEDIISQLAQGNLVIAPMAGRILENPNFRSPGPLYHMLLFIGYDKTKSQLITNDAGTRRGEGFRYSFENIIEAWADWGKVSKEPDQSRKPIIVVSKKKGIN